MLVVSATVPVSMALGMQRLSFNAGLRLCRQCSYLSSRPKPSLCTSSSREIQTKHGIASVLGCRSLFTDDGTVEKQQSSPRPQQKKRADFTRGRGDSYKKTTHTYRPKYNDTAEEEEDNHDLVYGVNPVLMALNSDKREIYKLLVQSTLDISNRKDDQGPTDILRLAEQRGVEKEFVHKQLLNRLTDNSLHQGFLLYASKLELIKLDKLEPSSSYR
jgi:hypothetical protein